MKTELTQNQVEEFIEQMVDKITKQENIKSEKK